MGYTITTTTISESWTNNDGSQQTTTFTTQTMSISDSPAGKAFAQNVNAATSTFFGTVVSAATSEFGPEVSLPIGAVVGYTYSLIGPSVDPGDTITTYSYTIGYAKGNDASASVTTWGHKSDRYGRTTESLPENYGG